MNNFFGFLRCTALMVMMMAWMMPAMAQHPFTLTTEDDVTNHMETLYWIESKGATGFYAIPHTDNSNVSTTNMPNLKALWYFMDAGTDSKTQYYYIVNHNTGYYLKLDGSNGGDNTIKIGEFGSGGDDFKFFIDGSEGQWVLYPKSGNGSYWVNKKGGNVSYSNYFKSSNYGGSPDANSKWNFVAENSVTWAHPFTNSTNEEKHYYLIQNRHSTYTSFYISTDESSYVTVSTTDNNNRKWYFVEASDDDNIPNMKYYYIVNAVTDNYMYFNSNTLTGASSLSDAFKVQAHSGADDDIFQFAIVNAKGDTYSAYSIMPKKLIGLYNDKYTSLGTSTMTNNQRVGTLKDRGSNDNTAHWVFETTSYSAVVAPTITNNYDGTISLSTTTPDAKIYYTIDGTTPSSSNGTLYESAFSLGSATVIKAITYNSDLSEHSDVTTYNVPKYPTPIISFNNSTSQITISSDGTVYYNTGDGSQSDPTPSSGTLYSAPFTVSSDITVKAIATHAGYLTSDVATWSFTPTHDYSKDYLTFDVLTNGTIAWNSIGSGHTETIQYSKNGGAWTSITASSTPATISVVAGDKVRFKGNYTTYATDKSNYAGFEGGTATFNIEGNIMSLLYGDSFADNSTLPNEQYIFCSIFKKALVISAENLILPATSLTNYAYRAMFSYCESLEIAPELPATTLSRGCYWYMFEKCAITTAPELKATTLVNECYGNMFNGCSNLNYIKCTAVSGLSASNALTNWVSGVAATGTFVKDGEVTWDTGASGIPSGWDVSIAAPEDPVITCDGEFITITCLTPNVDIYYRLGETGSYSSYSTPIAINENTVVEAYAIKNDVRSNTVSESCIAIKSYYFAGMKMTPGPLYYGSNGYEIKDGWNYDSYNSVYGKTVGSTYFNFIELGQLFESSVFSTSDGDIEKTLDPLDGWRIPTNAEWASIIGTTRSGSTVNETPDMHYAMIQLADVSGLLIFPDGETITGAELSDMDNTTSNTGITESQLNGYLSQGCVFLPGSGYYNGSWNNGHYFWSSTEKDSSTGYDLHFEPSNTISSTDYKNKGTYYFPVYLVKAAADEATRLLRTWTYKGNEVELPYSVNAIDGHSSSYAKGTFNFTTNVKIKATQPTYLWFQHADQSAEVYVDNTLVKKHWGGYNAFFVDITNYVHVGTNNIKVAIKNNEGNKLAPCAGDFNFNATLGEVKLISSPVVPDTVYGYDGFHITSTVTAASATITVKTKVPTGASLTCSIKGTNCDYSNTQTSTGEEITFETTITEPHLWNGTLDPYLYDVTLTIAKDGVVYHTFKRGYGLRFFEYVVDNDTPENSRFMLNGSPYLLRGVCMHHDLEGKANALTAEDIDNDFELLKDLGCNFVRLAHYPHPKEVYDHCDKMGIIVQTEVPCVNRMQSDLPVDYYNHLTTQYKDMVNQYFNHPCIVFWGLSNETTTDDKDFAKGKINDYISLIKSLDSSRLVGYVMSHSVDDPSGYYNDPDADWFGCNIYVGWYIDPTSNNPTGRLNTRLDKTLTRLSKPLAFSEYGCGGTPSCHSDDFKSTTTTGNNPRHDIEYQMWLHEGHIAAIKNFPQLLFTSQWQLFDIAVYNRVEGYKVCKDGEETSVYDNLELQRLNNKGLVERDHKTKKDTYYLYKAWWNQTDKFVHICGKDYKKVTDRVIKCYTNDGSTLKLYVNDVQIETATVTDNIATFTARTFTPGDVIRVAGDNSDDTFTIANYNVFTTEGDWNESSNWSAGAVPAAGCDVDIIANATVPSDYTANAGNITLYGSSTLTIEDGGQLYHNNEGVTATMQKSIAKYTAAQNPEDTETDRWHMIGSPVAESFAPSADNGFLTNEYDLYYYHEPTQYWRNYKASTNNADPGYDIKPLKGYLYANTQDVTLDFEGSLRAGNATVNVPLSYTSDAGSAKGFNLIGNPFAHDVTGYTGTSVASECYRMNGTNTELIVDNISDSNPLKTGEGFFVKATAENASITFNSDAKDRKTKTGRINLEIRRNNRLIDRLIVKNEGEPLEKLSLQKNSTRIFAMRDNKEMAVVPIDGNEQDIYFETAKNGTYTLTVSETLNSKLSTLNFKYLHLIDNQTGADVDLLQTPSYSFKAKTMDDADRFRLVFVCGDSNDDNKTFAFISNGNIIITADVEGATLQVIDVMGRVIVSREGDVSGNVSTSGMAAGTYILRLISGNSVMTQKIVIK